jgi:ATP-dependent helicase HrpA
MLQLHEEMRQLASGLGGGETMALQYKPLGPWAQLRDQILALGVDRALFGEQADIRTRDAFVARANDGWRRLSSAVAELNALARQSLGLYHELSLQLSNDFAPLLQESAADMREQLAWLMPANFLEAAPPQFLAHLPRYLRAMSIRLTKLTNAGLPRDRQLMGEVRGLLRALEQRRAADAARGRSNPQLVQVWWMLEELRVSLFAQELKTPTPVSIQRLQKQLDAIEMD